MIDLHAVPSDTIINATVSSSQEDPVVGKHHSLSCVVNVLEGIAEVPVVTWKNPNGTEITNSSLEFAALRASDGGEYTCKGMITSPVLEIPEVIEEMYNLTVECK